MCEHEACAHAAVGFKERDPGGRELNERDPYLKMCLPGDAGKGTGQDEGGGEPRMPDSRPEGRQKALAGCDSTHQGPCAFDHYLLG